MNYALISSIVRGAWAIHKDVAEAYAPFIFQMLNGIDTKFENTFSQDINDPKSNIPFAINPKSANPVRYNWYDGFKDAPEGSVAVIPIMGTLMKNDQMCGPMGTASLRRILKAAEQNDNIVGHLFHSDTPGGSVDGTEVFGNEILNAEKPTLDFIDGLEASAGVWLGSNAKYRMASTGLDQIGSIGVLMSFFDFIPHYEAQGIKFHQVVSNLSPDKTKMFDDLRKGKYEEYKKKVLDPIAIEFQNTIKKNLPNVTDDMMTGEVYMAKDLKGIMIDEIGTFDQALEQVADMAKKRTIVSKPNKNSAKNMEKFKHVAALLAIASIELDGDNMASLSKEQLEKIDATLAANETTAATLQTAQNDLAAKTTELEEAVTAHSEEITALKASNEEATNTLKSEHATALQEKDDQITALGEGAGAPGAKVVVKSDPDASEGEEGPVTKGDDLNANIQSVTEAYL